MITAVDTNVLLDILAGERAHVAASTRALLEARGDGALVATDVVWAEVAAWFADVDEQRAAMAELGIVFDPPSERTAALGGRIWRSYRAEGGSRIRLVPDFLIGAHALTQADRLLTRDRGFFRRYFTSLTLIDPSAMS
jgi:predicted nucleic acid-binding protein